jgi:hypothetical protein
MNQLQLSLVLLAMFFNGSRPNVAPLLRDCPLLAGMVLKMLDATLQDFQANIRMLHATLQELRANIGMLHAIVRMPYVSARMLDAILRKPYIPARMLDATLHVHHA